MTDQRDRNADPTEEQLSVTDTIRKFLVRDCDVITEDSPSVRTHGDSNEEDISNHWNGRGKKEIKRCGICNIMIRSVAFLWPSLPPNHDPSPTNQVLFSSGSDGPSDPLFKRQIQDFPDVGRWPQSAYYFGHFLLKTAWKLKKKLDRGEGHVRSACPFWSVNRGHVDFFFFGFPS